MTIRREIMGYLRDVGRATRVQIALFLNRKIGIVSNKLTKLKQAGIVQNIKWTDGSKVWYLTPEGYRRLKYYEHRERQRNEA